MSGLEILGIAASILQIADLGATVSVKLCTFYRQLKAADQAAQSLSSEVALTCSILRQLGENLKADETTRLYSAQAFETAQEVLRECEKVFRRISGAIDESGAEGTKNAIQRAARRLGFVLMERELDVLRGNLERLKSTMLLLLNVIMYAGQVRSRAEASVLREQREVIRVLVEEKKASERRLEQLTRSDELVEAFESLDTNHSGGSAVQDALPPYESLAQEDALRELRTYHQLVKRLLQEVDACKSGIERSRYSRIRNGVVRVHATEVRQFRRAHGAMVTRLFKDPLFSLAPESSGTSSLGSGSSQEDLRKKNKEPDARPKGILKPPRDKFPEEPSPVREGVVPLKDAHKKGIQPGAQWTKIDRQLVNPVSPEAGNERYEERSDYVRDTQNQEDSTEEAERRRRKDIARRRPVKEVDTRRHRRFPPGRNERDRLPLQEAGYIDADDFEIDSPTERFRVSDRMRDYRRAAFDYAPPPPAGIVDIENETRSRSTNRSANKNRKQRQEDTTIVDIVPLRRRRQDDTARFDMNWDDATILGNHRQDLEFREHQMEIERLEQDLSRQRGEHENQGTMVNTESEEETISRRCRRRRYAPTMVDTDSEDDSENVTILPRRRGRRASTSVSREASLHYQADYDLLADQRILEKNDARQDLELMKQQAEIERLERELARRRSEHENNHVQLIKEEEDRHKAEISERLRRLERFEKKQRMEEIREEAEFRLKLRKFEEAERQAAEQELAHRSDEHVVAIPVSATETEQEVKEAVDAVDDLLLKWTTLGQDDLLA